MDANKRPPSHAEYDPSTLYIPAEAWKDFTPTMRQYWKIKAQRYDHIVFFKLGKFYEVLYNDAIVCQRLLDLQWMYGPNKLHVGFPEKNRVRYGNVLVEKGYKVTVVEQVRVDKRDDKKEEG